MIKKKISGTKIIRTIIFTNVFFFIISLILSGSKLKLTLHPLTALTPSTDSLISLGASGTIPVDYHHAWWSFVTANFLHGSLLHILFNMLAFNQVASLISTVYGKYRMYIIFIISGVSGFMLSYLTGTQLTIGASAAICGLIGATLYYGKSRGGFLGDAIYRQTIGLVIFIVVFGILIPNIDNMGHGGGFISGIFLAWLLGYNEKKKENKYHFVLSVTLMIITVFILIWSLLSYKSYIINYLT